MQYLIQIAIAVLGIGVYLGYPWLGLSIPIAVALIIAHAIWYERHLRMLKELLPQAMLDTSRKNPITTHLIACRLGEKVSTLTGLKTALRSLVREGEIGYGLGGPHGDRDQWWLIKPLLNG